MKKVYFIFGFFIIAFFCLLFIRFMFGGPEDSWICKDNQWIKHGNPSYPKPVLPCGGVKPLPRNKEDCLVQGGIWAKQGPEPFETCNRKAKDRGNLCRDNGECEGMCQINLTREELNQGMRGKISIGKKFGQCSVWVVELGCFGMMKEGKAQVICVD